MASLPSSSPLMVAEGIKTLLGDISDHTARVLPTPDGAAQYTDHAECIAVITTLDPTVEGIKTLLGHIGDHTARVLATPDGEA